MLQLGFLEIRKEATVKCFWSIFIVGVAQESWGKKREETAALLWQPSRDEWANMTTIIPKHYIFFQKWLAFVFNLIYSNIPK